MLRLLMDYLLGKSRRETGSTTTEFRQKQALNDYIDNICLRCGDSIEDYGPVDIDGKYATQSGCCYGCEAEHVAYYKLEFVEVEKMGVKK